MYIYIFNTFKYIFNIIYNIYAYICIVVLSICMIIYFYAFIFLSINIFGYSLASTNIIDTIVLYVYRYICT